MPIAKLTSEAEQGNSESQYLLGRAYDEGTLVPRNLIEAISWYQKAADQGHPLACVVLGIECPAPLESIEVPVGGALLRALKGGLITSNWGSSAASLRIGSGRRLLTAVTLS